MEAETTELSRILNSSLLIAIGFLISGIFSVLTRIVLGRLLEPSGYGLISEGLAVLSLFTVLSLFGIQSGISRYMARDSYETDNILESGLAFVVPLSFLMMVISYILSGDIAGLLGEQELTSVVKAFSLNIPAAAAFSIIIGGFRGREETVQKVVLSMIFLPLSILVFTSLLTFWFRQPSISAYGYTISGWISVFIAGLWYFRRFGKDSFSLDKTRTLLNFSIPLGLRNLLQFGFRWSNILLIGYFLSSSSTGLYNAAFPLSYSMLIGLSSFNYLFMPSSSRIHSRKNYGKLNEVYSSVTRWLQILTFPLLIVLVLEAELILTLLFGTKFSSAAILLSILAVGQFAKVFFGPLGQLLIAMGETRREAIAKIVSLVVLLASGLLLIPEIGTPGAAVGFLLGSLSGELTRLYYSRKHSKFSPFNTDLFKMALAGSLSALILLPESVLPISIAQISLFIVLYLSILILLRTPKASDIRTLERILSESPLPEKVWRGLLEKIRRISSSPE